MPDILVRSLDTQVVTRLKAIARHHKRSLQSEVKAILQEAVAFSLSEARMISERWQKHLGNRKFTDSAKSIREDRNR